MACGGASIIPSVVTSAACSPTGCDHRNHLATIPAINAEVTIQCDNRTVAIELGHPNETGVRKRHWNAREFMHQCAERIELRAHLKVDSQNVVGKELEHRIRPMREPSEQKTGFRDDGFTGEDRCLYRVKHRTNPCVVIVSSIEQGNDGAGIDEYTTHLPYPVMCFGLIERSAGPSKGFTNRSTASVTERPPLAASACSASRTRAERLALRSLASSLKASASSSGSLKETVRIGSGMVLPLEHKGNTI